MSRRSSEYLRTRASALIVGETRGVPLKVISLILCGIFTVVGGRNFFFCGQPVFGLDVDAMETFQNCKEDAFQYGWSATGGLGLILMAAIRYHMCMTEQVADLYHSMKLLVLGDWMIAWIVINVGFDKAPLLYSVSSFSGAIYETYVLTVARRAYLVRQKQKGG